MKPFCLDLAKAGDGVVWVYPGDAPKPVHFIGIDMHGWAVVQTLERQPACFDRVKTFDLRMAPKKVARWVNFTDCEVFGNIHARAATYFPTENDARAAAPNDGSMVAIAVPVEIEV